MLVIETKDLGLAAYMKTKGARLLGCENRLYRFESEISKREYELEYGNSCCRQHDANVVYLRSLLIT